MHLRLSSVEAKFYFQVIQVVNLVVDLDFDVVFYSVSDFVLGRVVKPSVDHVSDFVMHL